MKNTFSYGQGPYRTQKSFILSCLLLIIGGIYTTSLTSCDGCVSPPQRPADIVIQDTTASPNVIYMETDTISSVQYEGEQVLQVGQASFFSDSIEVTGQGYHLQKKGNFKRVVILLGEDGSPIRTDCYTTATSVPAPARSTTPKQVYVTRGTTVAQISRQYKVALTSIQRCNPGVDLGKVRAGTILTLKCD